MSALLQAHIGALLRALPTLDSFAGACLLEPIEHQQHIDYITRRIAGERLVDAPQCPTHIVGDVACREFAEAFPCPASSYPAEEQDWVYVSLRQWSKAPFKPKNQQGDQNLRCELRMSRYMYAPGTMLPASQSASLWQMHVPPVYNRPSPPLTIWDYFQRAQHEAQLNLEQMESRAALDELIRNYEDHPSTLAQREQLVIGTELGSAQGAKTHKNFGLKIGTMPRATDSEGRAKPEFKSLLGEWNAILDGRGMPEELDFYPDDSTSGDGYSRPANDEGADGSQWDGFQFNNENLRETEQGEPHRESWLQPHRFYFNPAGKPWSEATSEDVEEITDNPKFATAVGEYEIAFCGERVKDMAPQLGLRANTFSQRISRQELTSMFHDVDFQQTLGHWFCVVTLNGVNHLKLLGAADATLAEVSAAFLKEWTTSERNAIQQTRRDAKRLGYDYVTRLAREREAAQRVADAFEVVIGRLVPDKEGFGVSYYHYFGHTDLILQAAWETEC